MLQSIKSVSLFGCITRPHVSFRRNILQPKARTKKETTKNVLHDLYPWKTKSQFVDHLASKVIYNEEGVVAINKPYGVPLRQSDESRGPHRSPYAIEDALEDLSMCIGVDKLLPAKMTERYTSGVSLFYCHDGARERIKQSLRVNHSLKKPTCKYTAVTIYPPQPDRLQEVVGVGSFTHPDHPAHLPVIMKEYSAKKVKGGLVTEFSMQYQTLSGGTSNPCRLVELDSYSNKNHLVRVYLAHRLSPILGDHIYGNRVHDVMGVKLAISPLQAALVSTFQNIPPDILKLLKVTDRSLVPTCLHLKQLTLSKFCMDKKEPLILKADLPPHFQYVLTQLSLI